MLLRGKAGHLTYSGYVVGHSFFGTVTNSKSQTTYVGQLVDWKRNGLGTVYMANGDAAHCIWRNNVPVCSAHLEWTDGLFLVDAEWNSDSFKHPGL